MPIKRIGRDLLLLLHIMIDALFDLPQIHNIPCNTEMRETDKRIMLRAGQKEQGFTLIEILVVIAIIAILAAIAIPQFAQYRIKGYNASASSDLRNGKTAEETLFADYQGYGAVTVTDVSPVHFLSADFSGTSRSISTSLSANVFIEAVTEKAGQANSYLLFTKHRQGDREFAVDGDAPAIYWAFAPTGAAMAASAIVSGAGNQLSAPIKPGGCTSFLTPM